MIVMFLEKVPAGVRGELTRWLLEVQSGVFIGHISARVRDLLWEKCIKDAKGGGVFQAWSTNTEQHYAMRCFGDMDRRIVDVEGIELILIPGETEKHKKRSKFLNADRTADSV